MAKSIDEIKENLYKDIEKATSREIEKIYSALKEVLKEFDKDSNLKNLYDFFKSIFKTKKAKCLQFVTDIFDSKEKLTVDESERLRKALLDISKIHRTIIENIIALLGAT